MRSAEEMDQADAELRETILKVWPLTAKDKINLLVPTTQGTKFSIKKLENPPTTQGTKFSTKELKNPPTTQGTKFSIKKLKHPQPLKVQSSV